MVTILDSHSLATIYHSHHSQVTYINFILHQESLGLNTHGNHEMHTIGAEQIDDY